MSKVKLRVRSYIVKNEWVAIRHWLIRCEVEKAIMEYMNFRTISSHFCYDKAHTRIKIIK